MLPAAERQRISEHARVVSLERGKSTTLALSVMECVDFPLTALMSVMGFLESGTTYEVAGVGTEGFVEVDAALESKVALRTAVCQFPGDVVRIPIDAFQAQLHVSPVFAHYVRRVVRARLFVTEQNGMCSLRHTIVERLARWLLVTHERLDRTGLDVTHDFLSTILGSRRAGVSEAAAALQARGAIGYQRGNVAIGDLDELAAASCECYAACRDVIEESVTQSAEG